MAILNGFPIPVSFKKTEIILEQMKNCICKIKDGTGFFCYIPFKNKKFPVLITSAVIIDEEYIKNNDIIKIKFKDSLVEIKDLKKNRIIYTNNNIVYPITIIEIKEEDNINNKFLELDDDLFKDYSEKNIYIGSSIYILQNIRQFYDETLPYEESPFVSYGYLKNISIDRNATLIHLCSTENGSIGSPILNLLNNKVIGIHEGAKKKNFNYGHLLNNPIKDFISLLYQNSLYDGSEFEDKKLISESSYGDIYSAFSIKDKEEICLKKINIDKMKILYQQKGLNDFQNDLNNEINILKDLSYYKNSVTYYGNYYKENERIIVMEKCDLNLKDFVKQRGKALGILEIKYQFRELNELFKLMQNKKIIHRDLKLENLLVKYINKEKNEYIIKLGDYGISKYKSYQTNGIFSGFKGTLETIAPEIILEKTKSYESIVDIYSLGVILYQLSNNLKHPYEMNYQKLVIKYEKNYDKDDLKIAFDKSIEDNDFKDLIIKMLKLNPKNRLNWEDYFKHPFFEVNKKEN